MEEVSKRLGTKEFHLTAIGKTITPSSTLKNHGLRTGDVINVNFRGKGGSGQQEELIDILELKEDKYLTRYNAESGAIFNLGDPDRLLTSILPFLEMTVTLKIKHSGLIKGPQEWGNWEWTSAMAKVLESIS